MPQEQSYQSKPLKSRFGTWRVTKREYEQQIREVKHGYFTPLVFSTCGGMDQEDLVVIWRSKKGAEPSSPKKQANALAMKHNQNYNHVVG